jgi:hypothetical protein
MRGHFVKRNHNGGTVVYWCETQLPYHHCVTFVWAGAGLDRPVFRDGLLTMRELGGYHPRDKNV